MTDHLPVPAEPASLPAGVVAFAERARDYAHAAKADNTRRAYASDWADFQEWCTAKGAQALPANPAVVLAYLIDRAETVKVATLQRRLVAIREAHRYAGHELETGSAAFRDAWRGLRRAKGQPANKKAPVLTADLRRAVAILSTDSLAGLRDRALLLLGFAAALRRSEIVALHVAPLDGAAHVSETSDGLVIRLGRTKTDQLAEGATIGVP